MDAELARGYRIAAALTRRHGTTYYWGALLLRPEQRRDVAAVYALCRLADDLVDEPETAAVANQLTASADPGERLAAFRGWFTHSLDVGGSGDPLMAAIVHTVHGRGVPRECFERFFDAMALDLSVRSWPTWAALRDGYMEGSAAVIGEMMLPVLEPLSAQARGPARSLGLAFQLTNFIRDVGEDLDRGRVYLPADDLARHGADPWLRRVTPEWRAFLAEQLARNRALYAEARPGLAMLPPASARCVEAALGLYAQILDRIEAADYDVFSARVRVPTAAKAFTAARLMVPRWRAPAKTRRS